MSYKHPLSYVSGSLLLPYFLFIDDMHARQQEARYLETSLRRSRSFVNVQPMTHMDLADGSYPPYALVAFWITSASSLFVTISSVFLEMIANLSMNENIWKRFSISPVSSTLRIRPLRRLPCLKGAKVKTVSNGVFILDKLRYSRNTREIVTKESLRRW